MDPIRIGLVADPTAPTEIGVGAGHEGITLFADCPQITFTDIGRTRPEEHLRQDSLVEHSGSEC